MTSNILAPVSIKFAGLQSLTGIVTNSPISREEGLTSGGSLNLRVDIKASAVTVVGAITAKLQHKSTNGTYSDLAGANASVTISTAGYFSLRQNVEIAADQPNMPIKSMVRVVLSTTNAGDAVTIDDIWIQQAR